MARAEPRQRIDGIHLATGALCMATQSREEVVASMLTAALTAIDAFQHADSNCALSFQTRAMDTLHAIVSLGTQR